MLRRFAQHLAKKIDWTCSPIRSLTTTTAFLKEAEEKKQDVEQTVLVDKEKNITLIGINRPQQRNAVNSETAQMLCDAFHKFEADESSPVAVLYGVGGSFCAGFDILEMSQDDQEEISVDILMRPEGSVGPTRRLLKKPVVCGINGYCVANGLELALMCDLRVMEESAVVGFFNRRFGVPTLDGGTVRLPAMIGLSRALDLILTGRPVYAQEAHDIGLVNRLVPTGTSLHHAIELATCLAKFPQRALNHDRHSVYSATYDAADFHTAVQDEIMFTSREMIEEMQEGIKWFNKTFEMDTTHSWLKREKSMADWDDEQVAEAAAQKQEAAAAKVEECQEEDATKSAEKVDADEKKTKNKKKLGNNKLN